MGAGLKKRRALERFHATVATAHFLYRAQERWGYRPTKTECRAIQADIARGVALALTASRYVVRIGRQMRVVVANAKQGYLLVTALPDPPGLNR